MSAPAAGMPSADPARKAGAIAIVCGGGGFPAAVAEAARFAGQEILLVGLRSIANEAITCFPHEWVRLGEIGGLLKLLKSRQISRMAFVGGLTRPELSELRLDWGAVKRLPEIARALKGGDDHTLRGIIRIFEAEGLEVVGVDAIAPALLAEGGVMVGATPDAQARADLDLALRLLDNLSAFDCGQGAVVANGRVIAIEAAEGTDAMLARVAQVRENGRFRARGRAGVLVKAPKRGQDPRIDLPAIGPATIEAAGRAGLAGVAITAGRVLVLDRAEVAARAGAADLFIWGVPP